MCNVKECPNCDKTISASLGYCWECWNKHRGKRQPEYQCKVCGIDITEREYEKFSVCQHPQLFQQTKAKQLSVTQQRLEQTDYSPMYTQEQDWLKLEQKNTELYLDSLIDDALDKGEKERFLELTEQLKQLKEGVVNG